MSKRLPTVLLLMVALLPALSHGSMSTMFEQYVNATPPRSVESATRVGATFGNATVRYNLSREPIVAFSPPSMRAGCGGIDFYAGGFSVINGDQLAQMGRAIIQGAPSYAFNLGLTSVCPSCSSIMGDLQSMLNNVNQFAQNSCQAAGQWLYENAGMKSLVSNTGNSTNAMLSGVASKTGAASDWLDGFVNPQPDLQQRAAEAGVSLEGNSTWNLLKASKVTNSQTVIASFYGVTYAEFIMSLMGTTVAVRPGTATAGQTNLDYTPYPPSLTLLDVVVGKKNGTAASPATTTSPTAIKLWKCDELVHCLRPTERVVTNPALLDTMTKTYRDIIAAIRGGAALSPTQLNYSRVAAINVMTITAAIQDDTVAGSIIAAKTASRIVTDLTAGVNQTLASLNALEDSPEKDAALKDGRKHADALMKSLPEISKLINSELESSAKAIGLAAEVNSLLTTVQHKPD